MKPDVLEIIFAIAISVAIILLASPFLLIPLSLLLNGCK